MSKTARSHEIGEALNRTIEKQRRLAEREPDERRKRRRLLRKRTGKRVTA